MRPKSLDNGDTADREYDGIYHSHWECGGLDVVVGRWLFGLLPKREYWHLRVDDGVTWPDMEVADIGTYKYRLRFLGRRGPRERCGHMGMCHRAATVVKVLECKRLT